MQGCGQHSLAKRAFQAPETFHFLPIQFREPRIGAYVLVYVVFNFCVLYKGKLVASTPTRPYLLGPGLE